MMVRTFVTCVLTLVFVVSFSHTVLPSMGGVTNVGPFLTQGESSTAIRELVELKKSGRLLVARPDHDLVEMITLYAPDISQGHLILRELTTREGQRTLLITAPDAVMNHVQRTTLYMKGLPDNVVLFEQVDGQWTKRLPQVLMVSSPTGLGRSTQLLVAFSLRGLGFYWLLEPEAATSFSVSNTPEATSARTLMGRGVIWALLPSACGILLLLVFGSLSRWIHKTPKLSEQ